MFTVNAARHISGQQLAEFNRAIETAEGRREIGQAFFEPFKQGRDYVARGRRLMGVHYVEPGAPTWYDKDPDMSAYVIDERGGAVRQIVEGTRVELVPFVIAVLLRVNATEQSIRRFDILNRAQEKGRARMAEQEDVEILRALRNAAVSPTSKIPQVLGATTASKEKLAQLFANVEMSADHETTVENLVMHAQDYRDFRSGAAGGWAGTEFDPVTRMEILKSGFFGTLWGANIQLTRKQTIGEVLAVASPKHVGVISVRIDLNQFDSPDGEFLEYGWTLFEFIGVGVLTDVAAGLMRITRA
jgi:hypothetical protein